MAQTSTSGRRERIRLGVILAFAVALAMGLASSAQAYVYWTNWSHGKIGENGAIGRANLDGGDADPDFITDVVYPVQVAVDAQRIYWTNYEQFIPSVGRAYLDGTGANRGWIASDKPPYGVAVDSQYVYWAKPAQERIARVNLDGGGVDQNFIGARGPTGVAVDAHHIYWTNTYNRTIGRANLDGTDRDQSFIEHPSDNYPNGLAVDAHHIYWTNPGPDTIGRANLDGSDVDRSFIDSNNADKPYGVAVNGHHIYWSNYGTGTIGRADLDGKNADQRFIGNADGASGVAVDGGGPGGREPRIVGSVDPHRATVDDRTCFRFHAENHSGKRLSNVEVRFAGKHDRTGRRGRAKICKTFQHAGVRHAHLRKRGFDPERLRVEVER